MPIKTNTYSFLYAFDNEGKINGPPKAINILYNTTLSVRLIKPMKGANYIGAGNSLVSSNTIGLWAIYFHIFFMNFGMSLTLQLVLVKYGLAYLSEKPTQPKCGWA